jgi:lipopolysaccharide assembly outer membrane protein LptD (OstA)
MTSIFSYSIDTTYPIKRFLIVYFLFFSIFCIHSQNKVKSFDAKSEKYIKVNHANRLLFDKESGIDAQRLIGSVECEHEGSKMYCDSAYLYNNKKLEAFGHILITKGDSIFVYGDSLKYDANTKLANLKGHVRCIENEMTLTTSILEYDLSTSIASYYNGGTIVNKENTLISKNGHYYSASKEL